MRSLRILPFLLVLTLTAACAAAEGGTSTSEAEPVASSSPATTGRPTTTVAGTTTTIDAADTFTRSLDATKTNYRFVSTVSVAESPVTTISGVVDAGAVSATIASGTGEVSYVKTGDGEWITDADGNWVVLEGEAPVNPPLDYLADSESLEVVSNDSSGLVLSGVLGPSAGTIAGVPFQVTILDGVLSTITYEGITGGEVAVVTTSLSDVGVAGTVTPPQ
jgi:hypothetical protein